MENNKISIFYAVWIIFVTIIVVGCSISLLQTTTKEVAMLFFAGGMFFVAFMLEMAMPDAIFWRATAGMSGVGFLLTSMMHAIFQQVILTLVMFGLTALSLTLIIHEDSPSPDS